MTKDWDKSDRSDRSDGSYRSDGPDRLIPRHGGYRKLRSFQAASLIYDATVIFCNRFVPRQSRTHDQMVQAARSGRQNIAEGSMASATSKKSELKLTGVARASLEELLLDYEDYLRHHGFGNWAKDSPQALAVRRRCANGEPNTGWMETLPGDVAANTMICLVNQATYLLKRQIQRLETDFLENGGFTEALYRKRTAARGEREQPAVASPAPECPTCGRRMILRTAGQGARAGRRFWGCRDYPKCRGTREVEDPSDASDRSDRSDKSDRSNPSDTSDRSD